MKTLLTSVCINQRGAGHGSIFGGTLSLAAAIQEATKRNSRKKPFNPGYIGHDHGQRLTSQKRWNVSPAIKTADKNIRREAALKMHRRNQTGESVPSVADESGVAEQTLSG